MATQETAYIEIERLVKSFKDMPAAQRKGLNKLQTRLGLILTRTFSHPTWLILRPIQFEEVPK